MIENLGDENRELPVAKNQAFYRSLMATSTGTLASILGITNYKQLARIETRLLIWYLYHQDAPYESWMDVWEAFIVDVQPK